jgi:hypothetical protein
MHRRYRCRHTVVAAVSAILFALVACPLTASAQPLADKVRSDALVYLAWSGAKSMGPGYEGSHLKAVLAESNFGDIFGRFVPQIIDRIARETGANASPIHQILDEVAGPMWHYPTALYVGGLDLSNKEKPVPHLALLCQAGADTPKMVKHLSALVQRVPKDAPPIRAAQVGGDMVVVSLGFERAEMAVASGGKSIAQEAGYRAALANVHKSPVLALYVDFDGIMKQVDGAVSKFAEPPVQAQWKKAFEASGLGGMKRLILTEGFEGADWGSRGYADVPGPRKGLLTMLDGAPLSDEMLSLIPRTSTVAGVGRFDFAKFFGAIRAGVAEFDSGAAQQVDEGLGQVRQMIGLDIERDVLAPLGDEWAYYIDPYTGGKSFAGFTLVNRLRDPKKAETSFVRLMSIVNEFAAQQLKQTPVRIAFKQTTVKGVTIHYLALPLVSPALAVADGNLYVALYPQTVAVAAEHVKTKSPSILQNDAFVAARKQVSGGGNGSSLQFVDIPRTAPDAYPGLLMLSRVVGVGDLFGVDSPAIVGPSMKTLMAHVSPIVTVSWADDKGWYAHSRQPFPFSTMLMSDPMGGGFNSLATIFQIMAEQGQKQGMH